MRYWCGTILGQTCSKSNSRQIITHPASGRPMVIKSKEARAWLKSVEAQVPVHRPLLAGDLRLTARIFYSSRRPDLDESLLMDALQGRIYENDRQIKEKHIYWGLDPANPRVVVKVEEISALPLTAADAAAVEPLERAQEVARRSA